MNKEERREKAGDILSEYRASSEPALCYSELLDELDAIYASDLTASQNEIKALEATQEQLEENNNIIVKQLEASQERVKKLEEELELKEGLIENLKRNAGNPF